MHVPLQFSYHNKDYIQLAGTEKYTTYMEISVLITWALAFLGILALFLILKLITFSWWISPIQTHHKLNKCGFEGPPPSFPLGNLQEMMMTTTKKNSLTSSNSSSSFNHDIHPIVFPYFTHWQKSYGKVFIYWVGTEPFLYIADAELLMRISSVVMAKRWGKPSVFRNDRDPLFGNGLVMVEGNDWVRQRHVVAPAFSPVNLKTMASMMVESTEQMMNRWMARINSGNPEIDVEKEIIATSGEIIARTSFGIQYEDARQVFEKLQTLQMTLFRTTRYVGVPFGQLFDVRQTLKARKLGKEIDMLLLPFIRARKKKEWKKREDDRKDLLGLLLEQENRSSAMLGKKLTTRELLDECKTFIFGGHETTALSITWTLLLLAVHQDWQIILRNEIMELLPDDDTIDYNQIDIINVISRLRKMKWVMYESLRLYPPAPNVQRQAREDIQVDDDLTVPSGTNLWIDVVSMHHDTSLWGNDAHEFKPERFMDDINGGCSHKMGYLPFGFGGRICVGRNMTFMEYKIVLILLLSRFSFKVPPGYCHSPSIALTLRPSHGLPLIVQPL